MNHMDDEIRVPFELPLDDDGFLRRECPNCEEQFKWYNHDEGDPDAETVNQYYCPLCGEPSGLETWWTPEQLEHVRGVAGPSIDQHVQDVIADSLKGIKGLTYKPNRNFTLGTATPEGLTELNDMIIAEPPCHPNEPVKIPEDRAKGVYCLVCGSAFAV